jgi:hypothetical protein
VDAPNKFKTAGKKGEPLQLHAVVSVVGNRREEKSINFYVHNSCYSASSASIALVSSAVSYHQNQLREEGLRKHLRHMGCREDEPRGPNKTPQNSGNDNALEQRRVSIK